MAKIPAKKSPLGKAHAKPAKPTKLAKSAPKPAAKAEPVVKYATKVKLSPKIEPKIEPKIAPESQDDKRYVITLTQRSHDRLRQIAAQVHAPMGWVMDVLLAETPESAILEMLSKHTSRPKRGASARDFFPGVRFDLSRPLDEQMPLNAVPKPARPKTR